MTAHWYYVDTSVALRALLGHSTEAAAWLEAADRDPEVTLVSSRILRTELTRVLRRERIDVAERDRLLDGISLVPMTDAVLELAESIVPHVRTLDAIHLASALAVGRDAVVVTHDAVMLRVAAELGLRTLDPVS